VAERAEADKIPHGEVRYEHPSRHSGEFCRICQHYIKAVPPRCEAVKSPIRAVDWCRRFELTKPGEENVSKDTAKAASAKT
jgi:hypothetical protein